MGMNVGMRPVCLGLSACVDLAAPRRLTVPALWSKISAFFSRSSGWAKAIGVKHASIWVSANGETRVFKPTNNRSDVLIGRDAIEMHGSRVPQDQVSRLCTDLDYLAASISEPLDLFLVKAEPIGTSPSSSLDNIRMRFEKLLDDFVRPSHAQ